MTLKDGAPRSLDVYLQHKEGFRTPASLRIIPVFKEDGEILGAVETFTSTAPKVTSAARSSRSSRRWASSRPKRASPPSNTWT